MPSAKPLLQTLSGEQTAIPPIWFMRQAGRYLPEYRALRAAQKSFLDLVYNPDLSAEITLQPIKRFGFDGAILFSDILVIPDAMGQKVSFEAGEGPKLLPRLIESRLETLSAIHTKLNPIYQTIHKIKQDLPPQTSLIGFAGSPWTVATYMLHGAGSKDQSEARRYAYQAPAEFFRLLELITTETIAYLKGQIDAGVEAVQLFDSWAGTVPAACFESYIIKPNASIVDALKSYAPQIPIIGFPRKIGGQLTDFVSGTGVDAIGLDECVDVDWAHRVLPKHLPVQGNLDPLVLIEGGEALHTAVIHTCKAFRDRPHIFNLGHGILPDTPIAHVEQVLNMVRSGC